MLEVRCQVLITKNRNSGKNVYLLIVKKILLYMFDTNFTFVFLIVGNEFVCVIYTDVFHTK